LKGPFIAVTDYVRLVPEQIRPWVPGRYVTIGTDGFGRSDTREALRCHFEVNAEQIVLNTLTSLAADQAIDPRILPAAIQRLNIDPEKPDPAIS
jgi:pyruvate dehydrogenase E1 component